MADLGRAIVLLSGGLDSSTTLALAKAEGFSVYALSFNYGQLHAAELHAAAQVAKHIGVSTHLVVPLDLRLFGGSALTADISVPKSARVEDIGHGIPVTYVPARNTIFLSFALAWAEVLKAFDIFIGVNALDYSGYPDCRPEFVEAYSKMANLATRAGVEGSLTRIHTPLISMKKAEIIQLGVKLGVDYSMTMSCYEPGDPYVACGQCDACLLRLKGFAEAGLVDPVGYASEPAKATL